MEQGLETHGHQRERGCYTRKDGVCVEELDGGWATSVCQSPGGKFIQAHVCLGPFRPHLI